MGWLATHQNAENQKVSIVVSYEPTVVGTTPRVRVAGPFSVKDAIKECPVSKWDPRRKIWTVPRTRLSVVSVMESISARFPQARHEFHSDISAIADGPRSVADIVPADLPLAVLKPWSHQAVGAAMVRGLEGCMLAWEMGCVDRDTEYLTLDGWKKISDYTDGDVICVFDTSTETARFEPPKVFINAPCEMFHRISHGYGVDQVVSDEHVLALETKKNANFTSDVAGDVIRRIKSSGGRNFVHLRTRFLLENGPGRTGTGLSERDLRLMVAIMADGSFPSGVSTNRCTVSIKKPRKINRFKSMIDGREKELGVYERNAPLGFVKFSLNAPIKSKTYVQDWWRSATVEEMSVILDECFHWDGSGGSLTYWSRHRSDADFIQFCAHSTGRHASIVFSSGVWAVKIRKTNRACFTRDNVSDYASIDGRKYCFTTSTGFWIARRNGCVFVTGNSGKTKPIFDTVVHDESFRLTLVVCPASVVSVWSRQYDVHVPKDLRSRIRVLGLTSAQTVARRARSLRDVYESHVVGGNGQLIVATNTEAVWRGELAAVLKSLPIDLAVVDESQRIANPQSQITKFMANEIAPRSRRRVCLSGTPLGNGPQDAFGQFLFCEPAVFGQTITPFRARYCVMGGYENRQVVAYQNLQEFTARMGRVTSRVRVEDVVDLPEYTDNEISVTLGDEAKKIYVRLRDSFVAEHAGGMVTATNAISKLLRLQQITSGFAAVTDVESDETRAVDVDTSKRDALVDIVDGVDRDEPLVVFCRFVKDLDAVREVALKTGRMSFEISGRVKQQEEWERDVDKARASKSQRAPIIAVQIKAGGVGIDLTRARYCVYYSLGYSLQDYEQSRARTRRPGQTRSVFYYHLVASGTVDVMVYRALRAKRDVVDAVISDIVSGVRE